MPVGYTQMFSFLENQTLTMPIVTAINSNGPVCFKPVINWLNISGKLKGRFCKDKGRKIYGAGICTTICQPLRTLVLREQQSTFSTAVKCSSPTAFLYSFSISGKNLVVALGWLLPPQLYVLVPGNYK